MELVGQVVNFGNDPIQAHPELARPFRIKQPDHELVLGKKGADEAEGDGHHDGKRRAFRENADKNHNAEQHGKDENHDRDGEQKMIFANVGFVGDDEPDAGTM